MYKLYNDDCLKVLRMIESNSVDLVIVDPPYQFDNAAGGGAFGSAAKRYRDELKNANIINGFNKEILDELCRVLKKINIYIWCNKSQITDYLNYFKNCSFNIISWHKTNPVPACSNHYIPDTEYCLFFREKCVNLYGNYDTLKTYYITPLNIEDKKKYNHPTIKPLNIIKNFVINSSKENDVVLDSFMGSGTTGEAALSLKRNFIGIEIDSEYFNTAKKRIELCAIQKGELDEAF